MNRSGTEGDCFDLESIYTFKSNCNLTYLVRCQLHTNSFYAVKFHLKNHTDSGDKYKFLTNRGNSQIILNTVLVIMESLVTENPYVSFGILGAPLLSEKSKFKTKRYRLYSRIFSTFFSPLTFSHFVCKKSSAYLLINRTSTTENLKDKIEEKLIDCYDILFSFKNSININEEE